MMREPTGAAPVPNSGPIRRVTSGVAAALAVTAMLVLVGTLALMMGLRDNPGTPGQPQPAAAGLPAASRPATPATSTSRLLVSPGPGGTPTPGATRTARPGTGSVGDLLEASEPTSIEIPSIGLRSSHFVPLSIQQDGTISVPGTAQDVGIYAAGPTPGQLGPSVLAAHVDTSSGVPGIFHELEKVRTGDVVRISRQDGSYLTFLVDKVQAYRKTQFPTELVYKGDFTKAEIRLVTCGGPTDSHNEYRDNVIVFGHLTGTTNQRPN